MDVIVRVPTPVGLVRWPNQPGTFSVVLKLTYDLPPQSWATLAERQSPLSEGEIGPSGLPLYPSDFVAHKRACDVVIVGRALIDHRGPLRLIVGSVDRLAQQAAALGPIHSGDEGCAALQQRMPFPTLPLGIAVEWGRGGFRSTIGGPPPDAALLQEGGGLVPIQLRVDTIMVEPGLGICTVLYRGSFQHQGDVQRSARLVVDALGGLAGYPVRALERWPRMVVEVSDDAIEGELEVTRDFVPSDALRAAAQLFADSSPPEPAPLSHKHERTVLIDKESLGLDRPPPEHRSPARTVPMRRTAAVAAQRPPFAPFPTGARIEDEETFVGLDAARLGGLVPEALPFQPTGSPVERRSAAAPVLPPPSSRIVRPASLADEITMTDMHTSPTLDQEEHTADTPSQEVPELWKRSAARTGPAHPVVDLSALPFQKTGENAAATTRPTRPSLVFAPTPDVEETVVGLTPAALLSVTPFAAPAPIAKGPAAGPVAQPAATLSATPFVAAGPRPAAPAPAASAAPASGQQGKKVMGFTLGEFTELRTKIAGDKSRRRAHLKAHGLTALKWREVERAWADEIQAAMADPQKVRAALADMRSGSGG